MANCTWHQQRPTLQAARGRLLVTNTPASDRGDRGADLGLFWPPPGKSRRRAFHPAPEDPRSGSSTFSWGRRSPDRRLGMIGMGRSGRRRPASRRLGMESRLHDPRRPPARKRPACGSNLASPGRASPDGRRRHRPRRAWRQRPSIFSRRKVRLLKREAILINVARGPIVDEGRPRRSPRDADIWAAGLDVYERGARDRPPAPRLDNVVLLPHIGSATYPTRLAMAMAAARNLVQAPAGRAGPENSVG